MYGLGFRVQGSGFRVRGLGMFRGYTLPPVMENQMEKIMENETETWAEHFTGLGSCMGLRFRGLGFWGLLWDSSIPSTI